MRVYFIGICGTGMATLAAMLKEQGYAVWGADQHVYPPMSDFLAARGIACHDGFDSAHITSDIDLVVIGNAVSRGNSEIEAVLDGKLKYRSLPEMVRETFLWDRHNVVIAGTHGKTTTAALVSWLLTDVGRDPSFLIGGLAGNFDSSYRLGSGREFVIEGDEYDSAFFDKTAKFLKYLPSLVVVGNLEFDHADIYVDLNAVRLAMQRLVSLLPQQGQLFLGADSREALDLSQEAPCEVVTFGLAKGADWRAANVVFDSAGVQFVVERQGESVVEVRAPLAGAFNVRNILAAFAVAANLGLDHGEISSSVGRFKGVKRRLEVRGRARGVTVYDDFAHHPTAVRETLLGVRAAFPSRRIWALFEPRSASACRRIFQDEFIGAFGSADEVVIGQVYRSSLPPCERLDERLLVTGLRESGLRARYIPEVSDIVRAVVDEAREGDLVVVMSNGAFGEIHNRLLAALGSDQDEMKHQVLD